MQRRVDSASARRGAAELTSLHVDAVDASILFKQIHNVFLWRIILKVAAEHLQQQQQQRSSTGIAAAVGWLRKTARQQQRWCACDLQPQRLPLQPSPS